MWIDRQIAKRLSDISRSRPAILLTGVRQSGKSSLLKKIFNNAYYLTFDHIDLVEAVKDSPGYFLDQLDNEEQVILEEIQYVPGLFRELKIKIDNDRHNYGKWILTGSQHFELVESLAGRISIQHLETFSANELRNADNYDVNYKDYLWKGGYPEIWSNKNIILSDFFESYIRTYIERDLKSIIEVKNLKSFRKLFRILSVRAGQLLNYKDISIAVGVSDNTVKKWINALNISGIIYLLPPYYSNIGKRLVKSPKLYFADHGFLSYLLGIESEKDWYDSILKGNIWENLVLMEMIKNYSLIPGVDIFFYRDQNGVEIDFIIEKKQKLYLIEAKTSERIDNKKLNFDKVVPLLENKCHKTEKILAHNTSNELIIKQKDIKRFNPLNVQYDLF